MAIKRKFNNYMDHLAPTARSLVGIQSIDQAAHQALSKRKSGGVIVTDWKMLQDDWDAIRRVQKRKERGGENFVPGDGYRR